MSTIKISQLATTNIALSDFIIKADAEGVATKNTVQGLADLITTTGDISFKGSIAISDIPSQNGWYFASETGTYSNLGGLVVDTSANITIVIVSGSFDVFNKVDIPLNIDIDAAPTSGSLNAVSSGGAHSFISTSVNAIPFTDNLTLNKFFKELHIEMLTTYEVSDITAIRVIKKSALNVWTVLFYAGGTLLGSRNFTSTPDNLGVIEAESTSSFRAKCLLNWEAIPEASDVTYSCVVYNYASQIDYSPSCKIREQQLDIDFKINKETYINWENGLAFNSNGSIGGGTSNYIDRTFYKVSEGDILLLNIYSQIRYIVFYDEDKVISTTSLPVTVDRENITIDAGVHFMRVSMYKGGSAPVANSNYIKKINPVTIGLVSDTYVVNDFSIKKTAEDIKFLNTNSINAPLQSGGYINNEGKVVDNASFSYINYFPVKEGEGYVATSSFTTGNGYVAYYDINKSFISSVQNASLTAPSNAYYFRISVANSNIANFDVSLLDNDKNVTLFTNMSKQNLPITKMFPNTDLPVISFNFDDLGTNDEAVVDLFESKGVAAAGFAFIASESNVTNKGGLYRDFQKRGFSILNHSINGDIVNTTNYPTEADALDAILTAKHRLEGAGIVANGWVSPSSSFESTYINALKKSQSYGFTFADSHNNGRSSNPCTVTRYSIQTDSVATIKTAIDSAISNDEVFTMYGHTGDFTTSPVDWDLDKVEEILDYVIAKRDLGLCLLMNTDECIKSFFKL